METSEIFSYIVLGTILIAIIIPLIALLHDSIKENKRLDENQKRKAAAMKFHG